jgi:hypothetical protein
MLRLAPLNISKTRMKSLRLLAAANGCISPHAGYRGWSEFQRTLQLDEQLVSQSMGFICYAKAMNVTFIIS